MNIIVLGLLVAAGLFAFGVLLGSGLHGRAVDVKYRRLAHLVRELNELQDIAARRGHRRVTRDERAPDLRRLVPRARQHDPLLGQRPGPQMSNGNPARADLSVTEVR